jgi:trk system potassium uptake protein TrkA
MYVIIVGGGKVGAEISRWLIEADQEITVIERDPGRCAAIEDELGSVVVTGDATESAVLREAGAIRADVVIATGSVDEENLVICQMAKHLFNVDRAMSIVTISEHVDLFERLGIDVTVDSTRIQVTELQQGVRGLIGEEIGDL